ncbi:MAG: hypothetical protein FWD57_02450 [Polyangiaceae bacterium]|nr:hypothetical protein [Polyangiaceae bacterium]
MHCEVTRGSFVDALGGARIVTEIFVSFARFGLMSVPDAFFGYQSPDDPEAPRP